MFYLAQQTMENCKISKSSILASAHVGLPPVPVRFYERTRPAWQGEVASRIVGQSCVGKTLAAQGLKGSVPAVLPGKCLIS